MTSLFPETEGPRLFGIAPGIDFPRALVAGLLARLDGHPPDALARVTVYVNTTRMQRRIREIFDSGPARVLPQIRLLTEAGDQAAIALPPPVSPLRRQLELARLTAALIAADPRAAPAAASFDLALTLAGLLDEMQGEGVPLSALEAIETGSLSAHWQQSLAFLRLIGDCLAADPASPTDAEGRFRKAIEGLAQRWRDSAPADPIILAGSTASRGTTRMLAQAVAQLPQGAVILPGVDFDMGLRTWSDLVTPRPQEDHPQYRFAALTKELGLSPADIRRWTQETAPDPARNRMISLALRPAPVTDSWRRDGPDLGDLAQSTAQLTLVEAPDPRAEANAIALILRAAAEERRRAALITPDRMLTRRVTAALARWNLVPDDSGGEPLGQTPAGRLLRHVAGLFGRPCTAEALIVLLKHPLTRLSTPRGPHLIWTRELELSLRDFGPPFLEGKDLRAWAARREQDREAAMAWADRLSGLIMQLAPIKQAKLAVFADLLRATAEAFLNPDNATTQDLWPESDGRAALAALEGLQAEADHGGSLTAAEFTNLLSGLLSDQVRDPITTHPDIMIWGTLEARVQGADLVVLGGLNEGAWPKQPDPDPWLNRRMRDEIGLLPPERQIGLAAHDFQQAVGASEAVLSRATRDADAATVPARWLNRLTNLIGGLPDQNGPQALAGMRARGAIWLDMAAALDRPTAEIQPAARPAPRPPLAHRPGQLSVTEVERLIRDPYAIYARRILRVKPLDPLRRGPEARDRGTVLHKVFERVLTDWPDLAPGSRREHLLGVAAEFLTDEVPWPTAQRFWLARLDRVADHFIAEEIRRQARATPLVFEGRGQLELTDPPFVLTAKADRIDRNAAGQLWIYDYKTGSPPTAPQQKQFGKQILLEAVIAEAGGFEGIAPSQVAGAEYIGLGATPKTVAAPLDDLPIEQVHAEFSRLISAFAIFETGYAAQAARFRATEPGDFDQLSRFGEWDLSDRAHAIEVGG
ncbi:MAG: double-strand break repair protein AddB [Pseudomonadota bacterium]